MAVSVRPATARDLSAMVRLLTIPERAAERLLHERTTIVAEAEGDCVGCLAYDFWDGTVHITHLGGDPTALRTLLSEPQTLEQERGTPLEAIVPTSDTETKRVIEATGFSAVADGPRFQNEPTVRYRLQPDADDAEKP